MSIGRTSDEMLILVVANRSSHFSQIAKNLNLRINRVSDCREAIDCLGTSAYAFLFIDIMGPDLEDLACIKSIRINHSRLGRSTPIIAMIDQNRSEETMQLRASGVSDFLEKPLTAQKLQTIIARWSTAIA